jgi:hypothetical protein
MVGSPYQFFTTQHCEVDNSAGGVISVVNQLVAAKSAHDSILPES